MQVNIQLKLYATLKKFALSSGEDMVVRAGTTIKELLAQLHIPVNMVKLVFIDGVKKDMTTTLEGGERVGIFPPVGGG